MHIKLTYKQMLIMIYIVKTMLMVNSQENDQKCLKYKKAVYEKTQTFSYFHPDPSEFRLKEDQCLTAAAFVVGGSNALPKEFPFAARLGHKDYSGYVIWFCGGTLISENIVLTAAHCFYVSLGKVNIVRLGELDFSSKDDDAKPEDFAVEQLIEHPGYNKSQLYNDIALVRLSTDVKFDRYKHPACLPKDSVQSIPLTLIAIGWGHTKFAGEPSPHLQKVTLKSYTYNECKWMGEGLDGRERLPQGLQNSQLCAGSTERKDTCQGDSGGALLSRHKKYPCMFNVIGVTSTGIGGCAIPNVPSLYTDVSSYLEWISDYTDTFT